jgi:hypothetical protein
MPLSADNSRLANFKVSLAIAAVLFYFTTKGGLCVFILFEDATNDHVQGITGA